MSRVRTFAALMTTTAVAFSAVPAAAPAAHSAKAKAKHCVAYKHYKKHGKSYLRCSKYSK